MTSVELKALVGASVNELKRPTIEFEKCFGGSEEAAGNISNGDCFEGD